jgi:hypothetical protein
MFATVDERVWGILLSWVKRQHLFSDTGYPNLVTDICIYTYNRFCRREKNYNKNVENTNEYLKLRQSRKSKINVSDQTQKEAQKCRCVDDNQNLQAIFFIVKKIINTKKDLGNAHPALTSYTIPAYI